MDGQIYPPRQAGPVTYVVSLLCPSRVGFITIALSEKICVQTCNLCYSRTPMTIARVSPYLWTTWLSKLLVGESSCEWAGWFKAHHRYYAKAPSDFDEVAYRMNHTALLSKVRLEFEAMGRKVFVEQQNWFSLPGKKTGASLEGKPDIIAVAEAGTICDVKTGQPKISDVIQVMIYMYAVPRALPKYSGMKFDGLVVYKDHRVTIPAEAIDDTFRANLGSLIQRLVSSEEANKVPSKSECGFCDLTKADCQDRVEDEPSDDEVEPTDDF